MTSPFEKIPDLEANQPRINLARPIWDWNLTKARSAEEFALNILTPKVDPVFAAEVYETVVDHAVECDIDQEPELVGAAAEALMTRLTPGFFDETKRQFRLVDQMQEYEGTPAQKMRSEKDGWIRVSEDALLGGRADSGETKALIRILPYYNFAGGTPPVKPTHQGSELPLSFDAVIAAGQLSERIVTAEQHMLEVLRRCHELWPGLLIAPGAPELRFEWVMFDPKFPTFNEEPSDYDSEFLFRGYVANKLLAICERGSIAPQIGSWLHRIADKTLELYNQMNTFDLEFPDRILAEINGINDRYLRIMNGRRGRLNFIDDGGFIPALIILKTSALFAKIQQDQRDRGEVPFPNPLEPALQIVESGLMPLGPSRNGVIRMLAPINPFPWKKELEKDQKAQDLRDSRERRSNLIEEEIDERKL